VTASRKSPARPRGSPAAVPRETAPDAVLAARHPGHAAASSAPTGDAGSASPARARRTATPATDRDAGRIAGNVPPAAARPPVGSGRKRRPRFVF